MKKSHCCLGQTNNRKNDCWNENYLKLLFLPDKTRQSSKITQDIRRQYWLQSRDCHLMSSDHDGSERSLSGRSRSPTKRVFLFASKWRHLVVYCHVRGVAWWRNIESWVRRWRQQGSWWRRRQRPTSTGTSTSSLWTGRRWTSRHQRRRKCQWVCQTKLRVSEQQRRQW